MLRLSERWEYRRVGETLGIRVRGVIRSRTTYKRRTVGEVPQPNAARGSGTGPQNGPAASAGPSCWQVQSLSPIVTVAVAAAPTTTVPLPFNVSTTVSAPSTVASSTGVIVSTKAAWPAGIVTLDGMTP